MAEPTTGVLETPVHTRPPAEDLVRAIRTDGVELRDAGDAEEGKTLFGHFARFNEWTEIDSMWEGHFMERLSPGAFKKSFRERQPKITLNHGMDRELGDRPIAAITDLREDDSGAYYEARLLDGLPEMVLSGLREGVYGASFRFSVVKEEWNDDPGVSDHNPKGIPERTIKETRTSEFGPVTFPAYESASAGVRSLTDEFNPAAQRAVVAASKSGATQDVRRLVEMLERREARSATPAEPETSAPEGADDALPEGSRDTPQDNEHSTPTEPVATTREPGAARPTSPTSGLYGLKKEQSSWRL